jgi:hypothetical protein
VTGTRSVAAMSRAVTRPAGREPLRRPPGLARVAASHPGRPGFVGTIHQALGQAGTPVAPPR